MAILARDSGSTRTVLADLDMLADKIDALIDAGVAVQA